MKHMIKRGITYICSIITAFYITAAWQAGLCSRQAGACRFNETEAVNKVSALSYVTWWSHDPAGYHPAILLKLENFSGKDLSGQLLRFQARFTDLSSGIVTVGRRELTQAFAPHQQIYVLLKGPRPFDLPIEDYNWPVIECKVMCRVGAVGDDGTQTLIVSKLDSITMVDDDALEQMSRISDFKQPAAMSRQTGTSYKQHMLRSTRRPPAQALIATAGTLKRQSSCRKTPSKNAFDFLQSKAMPGLGEDFYDFEKAFGLPVQTSTNDPGWTWASYKHMSPAISVLAGAKGKSSKVDVIIVELPCLRQVKDGDLLAATRCLSGTLKGQKLTKPARQVRYLPAGRMEMLTCNAPSFHAACLTFSCGSQDGNQQFLVVERVAENVLELISEHGKHAPMIKPIAQILGGT